MRKRELLSINPDPIKIVKEGEGLRAAFKPYVPPKRCDYKDGRGQCRAEATWSRWNPGGRYVKQRCEKHRPPISQSPDGIALPSTQ
jgi:hypothetical protein